MQDSQTIKSEEVSSEPPIVKIKQDNNKIQKVRKRASYLLFQELYDFLKNAPDIADILKKIFNILDSKRSFGSRRNAECAFESLDLLLDDKSLANELSNSTKSR